MMKPTILALLAFVTLSATATSAADTAESLAKESQDCTVAMATTQKCPAGCSMQKMDASLPDSCLPTDYMNRMMSLVGEGDLGLTDVEKAATKCALDFMQTKVCGAGCQQITVEGQVACSPAGVPVAEMTAAPGTPTDATDASAEATTASAEATTASAEATTAPAKSQASTAGSSAAGPGHNQMTPHDDHGNHGADSAVGHTQTQSGSESHSGSGPFGNMFNIFSAEEQKKLGLGGKGDKCKGFKIWLAMRAAETKCAAFDAATDPEAACKAGGCEYECTHKRWVSGKETCLKSQCSVSEADSQKAIGINLEQLQKKAMAKQSTSEADGKAALMSVMKEIVPVINDMNTTMLEIEKFEKRCHSRPTATCTGDKVCELQMDYNESNANFTQTCSVAKAKAVAETGCDGVAKAVADVDAAERKAVADGAKKFLEGKKADQAAKAKKLKEAKQALKEAKDAGKDTADLERRVSTAEAEAAAADESVKAASAAATTADADAAAAEQKAADTPADSSTLRALPSIMAVVAATIAAAFA